MSIRCGAKMQNSVAPKKPHGRTLADFPNLTVAEKALVKNSANGSPTIVRGRQTIRSSLIRFLALGGDESNPVFETGIEIVGARITGRLDLSGGKVQPRLIFKQCEFDDDILLNDARTSAIELHDSRARSINARRTIIYGSLKIIEASKISGQLDLENSQIKGNLELSSSTFGNDSKDNRISINICRVKCDGNIYLKHGFVCNGTIVARGAEIEGSLDASECSFLAPNTGSMALHANGMVAKNGLFWKRVKAITGEVNFNGSSFSTLSDDLNSWIQFAETARFSFNGFSYRRISSGSPTDSISRLQWLMLPAPERHDERFVPHPWEHLIRTLREMGHRRDAAEIAIRLQAEKRQLKLIGSRRAKSEFWLPWSKSCKYLYEIRCSIDKGWNKFYNHCERSLHWIYGVVAGYGYKPARIFVALFIIWILCAIIYQFAANNGVIAPTDSDVFAHSLLHHDLQSRLDDAAKCGVVGEVDAPRYWPQCPNLPSEYTTFNQYIYSADVILPLVDLQQDSKWAPISTFVAVSGAVEPSALGRLARALVWFEIISGWVLSLMLVAIITRLVNRDQ